MTKIYSCNICNKIFKQKSNYESHINKKYTCAPNTGNQPNITNGDSILKLNEILQGVPKQLIDDNILEQTNRLCRYRTNLQSLLKSIIDYKKSNFNTLLDNCIYLQRMKFSDLIEKSKYTIKNETYDEYNQIMIMDGKIVCKLKKKGSEIKLKNINVTQKDDFIISKGNFKNKEYGIIDIEHINNIIPTEYNMYTIDENKILVKFFSKILETDYLFDLIHDNNINDFDKLLEFHMKIPILKEQQQIIDSMLKDDQIELYLQNKLEEFSKNIDGKIKNIINNVEKNTEQNQSNTSSVKKEIIVKAKKPIK